MSNTFVDERINALISTIEEAPNALFGGSRCTVDREQILDMLDEIRGALPQDMKMARDIVEKRNDVISAGKREAEAMKKQAEELARQMVNEHDIVVSARRQAAEITDSAETRAREIVSRAEEYARQITEKAEVQANQITTACKNYCESYMNNAENTVQKALTEIQETHRKMQVLLNINE